MPAVWAYPWTLESDGLNDACADLVDRGIDAMNLATHYHSVQTMQARRPDALFQSYTGGWYVDSEPAAFAETPIDPPAQQLAEFTDPLAEIIAVADEYDLAVNAWTVCLHNTRLGSTYPEFAIESAFGDRHDHGLCPSHPDVREYLASVVREVVDRGVAEVQLESIGFQSAFHSHGDAFGHPKRHVRLGTTGEVLLSQCFCDGCRKAARDQPVDIEAARELVQDLVSDILAQTRPSLPSLTDLCAAHDELAALFAFRATVIERLLAELQDATGAVPLSYYTMEQHLGTDPTELWPAGVDLESLQTHLDRVLAICYVDDPDAARERVETLSRLVDLPVDAGITLDPTVVETQSTFEALVETLERAIDGSLSTYHYGVAPQEQLEWVADAFA